MPLSRLVKIAVALWLLRWAAGEAAAYAGRHRGWPTRRSAGTE
jgi:hypothetical protein